MAELTPPPQSVNISTEDGSSDPAWFNWFQEIWDKSRIGFQTLVSKTIDSDETMEFVLTDTFAGFKDYKVVFNNVLVSQPDTLINMQISTDAGSSYENASADYSWIISLTGDISYKKFDNEDVHMQLIDPGVGNELINIVTGEVIFYDLSGDSSVKFFRWDLRYKDSDGNIALIRGAGSYNDSPAVNGIKFFPDKGKFSSGELEIFGSK